MSETANRYPLILAFDGYCPTCHWFVKLVIRLDKNGRIGLSPLHSPFSKRIIQNSPQLATVDSVLAIRMVNGQPAFVLIKSEAVFEVVRVLGGFWRCFLLLKIFPKSFLNKIYDWIAANRYCWFGKYESCELHFRRLIIEENENDPLQ